MSKGGVKMSNTQNTHSACTALIGSVTYALKAQKILSENAIGSSVGKVSSKSGCAYGVTFPMLQKNNVEILLSKHNIRVKKYL